MVCDHAQVEKKLTLNLHMIQYHNINDVVLSNRKPIYLGWFYCRRVVVLQETGKSFGDCEIIRKLIFNLEGRQTIPNDVISRMYVKLW